MPTINGKEVTFKANVSNRGYWELAPILAALQSIGADGASLKALFYAVTYDDALRLFTTLIESWEFNGDPSDAAVYEALDPIADLMPLFTAALEALGVVGKGLQQSGEAEGEPTSQ